MKLKKIDYEYYEWLVSLIRTPPGKTYHDLFNRLHNLEFVWTVPNDHNRIADGLDLRREFLNGSRQKLSLGGGTLLEVVVALSRRLAFQTSEEDRMWAWRLLKNLGLNKMSDPLSSEQLDQVDDILYNLVWRGYRSDGKGGFFPLKHPKEDQTKVEIWYQMHAYLIERNPNPFPI